MKEDNLFQNILITMFMLAIIILAIIKLVEYSESRIQCERLGGVLIQKTCVKVEKIPLK
jgi:hypothetical protein